MTKATIELIDQLCDIIDKSKYLILSGTMAVGKTYLANLIAERCREAKYNAQGIYNKSGEYEIETELISIHPSFYYEDFVNGITIDTESGNINFHYADKVFLTMLKKANKSWEKKEDKKYFLILDDISRGAISGILGDMLPLIEPHGLNVYRTVLSSGETISVSPNVYIIATRSTIIDSVEQMNYGFLRHFYEFQLRNDYLYMCDTATDVYSDYDMSANALFYRTKRIVTDHLRHRYQMSLVEKERYIIGHGVYKESGTALIARNQIIPLLRQYVKDNVLAKTANVSIAALQKLVDGQYSKDRTLADVNRIVLQKTGITADSFSVLFDCIVNQNVNSNLDKLFIKPVLQADRAFDDNKSIEDFNSVTDLYVLSVTMDSINAVPDYYEHCKNDIEKRKRSTCLKKFYNINIEELEMLLFMVEKQYDIFELLDQYFAEKYMMPLSNYIKSKCPEVIKMTSFLSGVYEEASIKMKEAYGIV